MNATDRSIALFYDVVNCLLDIRYPSPYKMLLKHPKSSFAPKDERFGCY